MFTFDELVLLRKGLDALATDVTSKDDLDKLVALHVKLADQQSAQQDGAVCACPNTDGNKGTWLVCVQCLRPRR